MRKGREIFGKERTIKLREKSWKGSQNSEHRNRSLKGHMLVN